MTQRWECLDGNEAAARIAYQLSEVISIYPITPASPMAEHTDDWSAARRPNLWGVVPDVVEMQSEAGAAGALHGALQKGALGSTFTASQGLLLMIPNMFKIAGELTPSVIHVSARTIATHALSIYGDHSDVMAARSTGWAMLAAGSVQEVHDLALVAHAATLRSRIPFLHFFDGFRTSHEVDKIATLDQADIRALVRESDVLAFRARGMSPESPVVRGTAQNPDVFFQAREAANPYMLAVKDIVREVMAELAARTGRPYDLVSYSGAPDAERVILIMGSGIGAVQETVETLTAAGKKVGVAQLRLFQPFPTEELVAALPSTVRSIAVLDRCKEPGAIGEPLYLETVAAIDEAMAGAEPPFTVRPRILGGRYGLSSKEFTPSMVTPIFEELAAQAPKRHFTVGIYDDVTNLSLPIDTAFIQPRPAGEVQAMFFGLGSDGTVGANKASVKIIGEETELFAQGHFLYDSKKSGTVTVSHLRFGPSPIRSTYEIQRADFVACHQFGLLAKQPVLARARQGATFLLNSPYSPDEVWQHLPATVQRQIVEKDIAFYVIDAFAVAAEVGMGNRINTVMQPCFFKLAGVLPEDEAIAAIKGFVKKAYGKRGEAVVERNYAAIDRSLEHLHRVTLGAAPDVVEVSPLVPDHAPDFVKHVTARIMAGEGDLLPVSAFPVDGTFPTATTRWEKRAIAQQIPVWDASLCIDCGKCAIVCPHASIRMKVYPVAELERAPVDFLSKEFKSRDLPDHRITIQVSPDDCTGCGVCVDVCPAKDKTELRHKAIDLAPYLEHRDLERARWEHFLTIPPLPRGLIPVDTIKGSQVLEPLFEFSGACAGCGETPYVKLVSQLFGDRMIVANATGCSSIYGGNLPTTPWAVNAEGRGPAWNNSLFEDNAEFGLGMRLALDVQAGHARALLERLAPAVGEDLARELLENAQADEAGISAQRAAVERLRTALRAVEGDQRADAETLLSLSGDLVRTGVWIIGGDGWAYDIGFGGLDQALSSGRDVNILVLDTQVYSNTGGQASKATPRGAVAKFAAAGKGTGRKDLGAIARAYGNVYVAQIALGASDAQSNKAILEAEAWPGPSLIIAYSTCIAHGIDLSTSMGHQRDAVRSGFWPLYRYQPSEAADGQPFKLDSKAPSMPIAQFVEAETRFAILARTDPERAAMLGKLSQADADERWRYYSQLAELERSVPHLEHEPAAASPDGPSTVASAATAATLSEAAAVVAPAASAAVVAPAASGAVAEAGAATEAADAKGDLVSVDLTTRYLGLSLRSPIIASASPITRDVEQAMLLDRAGVGAIVLPSLFEEEVENEQLELSASLDAGTEAFAESLDYFPEVETFIGEGDRYLRTLERVKRQVGVPVIGSLNANSVGGWVRYARLMADAGADALELNLYRISVDRWRTPADVEAEDLELVAAVRAAVSLPFAVKLSPFYTALANFAGRVIEAGANGLVLFNRFYQPDIDLDELAVVPRVSLSHPSELRLPMRWTAILRPQLGPGVGIAATTGIHSGEDAVKAVMVGADVVALASALLRGGAGRVAEIEAEMRAWLIDNEYSSVTQLRSSASQGKVDDPGAFERAQYIRTLHSWVTPAALTPTA